MNYYVIPLNCMESPIVSVTKLNINTGSHIILCCTACPYITHAFRHNYLLLTQLLNSDRQYNYIKYNYIKTIYISISLS